MTYHSYYQDPSVRLRHRRGLTAWGVVLIVFGSLLLLGACAGVLALVVLRGTTIGTGSAALVASVMIELAAASLLLWMGIATLRGQRWVAPVIAAVCVLAIAGGCAGIANDCLVLPRIFSGSAGGGIPNQAFVLIGIAVTVVILSALVIVLPIFMLRFFIRPSVRETLAEMDPQPRWTDTIPLPVMVWGIGGIAGGIAEAVSGFNGVLPAFTGVLFGPPAVAAGVVVGVGMTVGGVLTLRRSMPGVIVLMILVFFVTASMTTFTIAGDWNAYRDALTGNIPAAQRQLAERMIPDRPTLSAAVLDLVALVFGLTVPSKLRPAVDPSTSVSVEQAVRPPV